MNTPTTPLGIFSVVREEVGVIRMLLIIQRLDFRQIPIFKRNRLRKVLWWLRLKEVSFEAIDA